MATVIQRRRGTTAQHATFTGALGELTVDTTKKTVVVHDGATAGGIPLAREDLSNVIGALTDSTFPAIGSPALLSIKRRVGHSGSADIRDFGGVSGTDCTSAINAAIADSGCTQLYIPPGNWWMNTQPNSIERTLEFVGESMSDSVLVVKHANSGLVFTGVQAVGGALRNLSINFDIGASNGTAHVQLVSQAGGGSPDYFIMENCNFSAFGSSTSSYGLVLDGNARVTGAVGLRNVSIRNIRTFNTTVLAIDIRQCRALTMADVSCFTAGGSNNGVGIGGVAGAPSSGVLLSNLTCGDLSIDRADRVLGAPVACQGLTYGTNASECNMFGAATTVANSGTGCFSSMA